MTYYEYNPRWREDQLKIRNEKIDLILTLLMIGICIAIVAIEYSGLADSFISLMGNWLWKS